VIIPSTCRDKAAALNGERGYISSRWATSAEAWWDGQYDVVSTCNNPDSYDEMPHNEEVFVPSEWNGG